MESNRQLVEGKSLCVERRILLSNKLPDYRRDQGLPVATANDKDVG